MTFRSTFATAAMLVAYSATAQEPRKDQYDALATPITPHLAALVKQLETQERG